MCDTNIIQLVYNRMLRLTKDFDPNISNSFSVMCDTAAEVCQMKVRDESGAGHNDATR